MLVFHNTVPIMAHVFFSHRTINRIYSRVDIIRYWACTSPPCLVLKQEDDYLRDQYPRYADTPSAFAVLSTADEMEAKDRTEAQIMKRVKKLGITAATQTSSASDNDEGENELEEGSGDEDTLQAAPHSSSDGEEGKTPSPVRVRHIERKSQAQSDDDSDGMFSSLEVRVFRRYQIFAQHPPKI